jgi:RNA polymerase sigma-70 factor (ECF subfamily)
MRELVTRCKAGDREAFGSLVQCTRAWALRYARALLNGDLRAEDAVQEAFVTALERIGTLRNDEAFFAWMRCIIRTQVGRITRERRSQPLGVRAIADPAADPSALAESEQLREIVIAAMSRLSPADRETVDLFYLKERSIAEVSRHLGVPAGTVKRRLHDARRQLRRLLSPEEPRTIL